MDLPVKAAQRGRGVIQKRDLDPASVTETQQPAYLRILGTMCLTVYQMEVSFILY